MKKRITSFVRWVAILTLLVALGYWGFSSFIQTKTFRDQIASHLSSWIQLPLTMDQIHWTPLDEFSLSQVAIPYKDPEIKVPFAQAKVIELETSWKSVLGGPFTIQSLKIQEPQFVLQENQQGNVPIPWLETDKPEAHKTPQPETKTSSPPSKIKEGPLVLAIQKSHLEQGSLIYRTHENKETLHMEGINTTGQWEAVEHPKGKTSLQSQGSISLDRLVLGPRFSLSAFRTPYTFQEETLTLPAIQAKVYGGQATGNACFTFGEGTHPYQLSFHIKQLQLNELLKTFKGSPMSPPPHMQLTFEGKGDLRQASQIQGKGRCEVGPIESEGVPLLGTLAQLIGLPGFSGYHFKKVIALYEVGQEKVHLQGLVTHPRQGDLAIMAAGDIDFDGALKIQGLVTFSGGLVGGLDSLVKTLTFKSSNGFLTVPFSIEGSLDHIKIKVSPSSVGGSLIRGILDWMPVLPVGEMTQPQIPGFVDPDQLPQEQQKVDQKKKKEEKVHQTNKKLRSEKSTKSTR